MQAVSVDSDGVAFAVPLVTEILFPEGFVGWQVDLGYPGTDSVESAEAFLLKDLLKENANYVAQVPTVSDSGQSWAFL